MEQLSGSGYLSEMAAVGCSSLYWLLLKDLWKAFRRSVSVAQDTWCVRTVHLSRKHSFLSGETWKSVLVSSKGREVFISVGAVGTTIWDNC